MAPGSGGVAAAGKHFVAAGHDVHFDVFEQLQQRHAAETALRALRGHIDLQRTPVPVVRADFELHGLRRAEPLLGHVDVAGDDLQIILRSGLALVAADGHGPDQLAGDQLADLALLEVEGVELQNGALRRLQNDGPSLPLLFAEIPFGQEDHGAGNDLHAAFAHHLVVIDQQHALRSFQDLGRSSLPFALGKPGLQGICFVHFLSASNVKVNRPCFDRPLTEGSMNGTANSAYIQYSTMTAPRLPKMRVSRAITMGRGALRGQRETK